MKFIHLSDLHLGKKISNLPMLEEQRHFLFNKVIPIIKEQEPDGILIAGDVFDRSNPPAEALALFDDFLVALTRLPKHLEVFVISGNHDGAERIAYGSRILDKSGLHMSPVYDGNITPITMKDAFGELDVYMLPFLRKATVQYYFPDENIQTENDAIAAAVKHMGIDTSRRTVCLSHQFVSGASISGAEESNVGGLDCISADAFAGIDYVALGHIHKPQSINKHVRYSGSPLKYSIAEVDHQKSITIVELKEKGNISITEIPVTPINDWYDLRGKFDEITSSAFRSQHPEYSNAYLRITLTDENDIIEGYRSLKKLYPNMVEMHYDNARTRASGIVPGATSSLTTDEDFIHQLFLKQNGREMNDQENQFIKTILKCDL
ncbi:MAG: exonuclease SbcCD subunit D [Bacteroidales bacterium]|nr:exonuclease SbcCD subunit D [Bacteroidales bacterium]